MKTNSDEKIGTVALILLENDSSPKLLEALSDDQEISLLDSALQGGESNPIEIIEKFRQSKEREDQEFGDYVEELLSQPFVRPDIQKHCVDWLKSKMRIEEYLEHEREATKVIAEYAYRIYLMNPKRTEFLLSGPKAKVRIRIFVLSATHESNSSGSMAA